MIPAKRRKFIFWLLISVGLVAALSIRNAVNEEGETLLHGKIPPGSIYTPESLALATNAIRVVGVVGVIQGILMRCSLSTSANIHRKTTRNNLVATLCYLIDLSFFLEMIRRNSDGRSDFFVGMEAHSRKLGKKLVVPAKAGGRPA